MGAIKFDCNTQDFERNAKKVMQEIKTDELGIIKQMRYCVYQTVR